MNTGRPKPREERVKTLTKEALAKACKAIRKYKGIRNIDLINRGLNTVDIPNIERNKNGYHIETLLRYLKEIGVREIRLIYTDRIPKREEKPEKRGRPKGRKKPKVDKILPIDLLD